MEFNNFKTLDLTQKKIFFSNQNPRMTLNRKIHRKVDLIEKKKLLYKQLCYFLYI